MKITYQKKDGSIFQRIRNSIIPYKIGDRTSMGWTVLNIEYEYKNKFYTEYQYDVIIHKNRQLFLKKKKLKELFFKEIKTLLYYIIAFLIINWFIKK